MTWDGNAYQRRFDDLAGQGVDVHGEATFVLRWDPVRVLDAGCGSGRVARELARHGVDVVGIDRDPSMIGAARRLSPDLTFLLADLTVADLGRRFDLVVMAGNVPLFTPEGTREALVAGCARHLLPGGLLVAGFQLDRGYDPAGYGAHCGAAGLVAVGRWATWDGDPDSAEDDYAVFAHRAPA